MASTVTHAIVRVFKSLLQTNMYNGLNVVVLNVVVIGFSLRPPIRYHIWSRDTKSRLQLSLIEVCRL